MGKFGLGLATVLVASVSAGCSLFGAKVPKCSDDQTLDLVRQILAEGTGAAGANELPIETLRAWLLIELPHATSLEENIKKYTCEATLIIKDGDRGKHRASVSYTTQLDDNNDHLVQAGGLAGYDMVALVKAIDMAIAKRHQAAEVAAVNPASAPEIAPEVAMATDAEQSATTPAGNTPEQVAANNLIRAQALSGTGEGGTPSFADYPVDEVFTGPSAPLDMRSEDAKMYETRLSDALSEGTINFAGKYISAGWGCGTGCAYLTFVNKINGQVISSGIGGEGGPRVVNFLPNSRLLIAEGPDGDDNFSQPGHFAYYYEMKDSELVLISKRPIPQEIF